MDKLAAFVLRLHQIRIEFGQEVGSRAVYAASVAVAQVILDQAEDDAGLISARRAAEIVPFPARRIRLLQDPTEADM